MKYMVYCFRRQEWQIGVNGVRKVASRTSGLVQGYGMAGVGGSWGEYIGRIG